jgi:hypothetical protein
MLIAVITRFIGWFHEFGIPVGGVIAIVPLFDREVRGTEMLGAAARALFA